MNVSSDAANPAAHPAAHPAASPTEDPTDWLEDCLRAQASAQAMEATDGPFTQAVLRALPALKGPEPTPRWVRWAARIAAHPHLGLWMVLGAVLGLMIHEMVGSIPLTQELTSVAPSQVAQLLGPPVLLSAWLWWCLAQGRRWLD